MQRIYIYAVVSIEFHADLRYDVLREREWFLNELNCVIHAKQLLTKRGVPQGKFNRTQSEQRKRKLYNVWVLR